MKINEMTGERVKNNSNRVVFSNFFFFFYLCGVSGVEKLNGMESKAKSDDREFREVICMVNKRIT